MLQSIMDAYPEEEFLVADGLDAAIIGVETGSMRLIYSVASILECLMAQGMTADEADEWYEFNILGAYVGEKTPIYCDDLFETDESHLNN